jgi:hypothetical protein
LAAAVAVTDCCRPHTRVAHELRILEGWSRGCGSRWQFVGICFEDQQIDVAGAHPWQVEWGLTSERITVAHPQYPAQPRVMSVYEVAGPDPPVRFAAGKFSTESEVSTSLLNNSEGAGGMAPGKVTGEDLAGATRAALGSERKIREVTRLAGDHKGRVPADPG